MCDCIEQNNKALADMGTNTQLDIPITLNRELNKWTADRVAIAVCKLDDKNRKKPIVLIPSFCPFCGEKYK